MYPPPVIVDDFECVDRDRQTPCHGRQAVPRVSRLRTVSLLSLDRCIGGLAVPFLEDRFLNAPR